MAGFVVFAIGGCAFGLRAAAAAEAPNATEPVPAVARARTEPASVDVVGFAGRRCPDLVAARAKRARRLGGAFDRP